MGINISGIANNTKLFFDKYSPEMLTGFGVASMIGTVILASKATLKVEAIVDEAKADINTINESEGRKLSNGETYSATDQKRDRVIVYAHATRDLIKLYSPAVALGIAGIGMIFSGHIVLSKRNASLVAAYGAVSQAFSAYRDRVREDVGAEKEQAYYTGLKKETVEVVDEKTGKKSKEEQTVHDGRAYSPYARSFDELNENWNKDAETNRFWLQSVESQLNDKLKAQGVLFLNEAYDALGFDRSKAGAIVGWVYDPENGEGDNFVDFGLFTDTGNPESDFQKRLFINGQERSVYIDFNVDGVIYDQLRKF